MNGISWGCYVWVAWVHVVSLSFVYPCNIESQLSSISPFPQIIFHFLPLFISHPSTVLTLTGVTDTPSPARPGAVWTEAAEDQHVTGIGTETEIEIENARTETGIRIRKETETETEIRKMKETPKLYLQYLRKSLLWRIKVGFILSVKCQCVSSPIHVPRRCAMTFRGYADTLEQECQACGPYSRRQGRCRGGWKMDGAQLFLSFNTT